MRTYLIILFYLVTFSIVGFSQSELMKIVDKLPYPNNESNALLIPIQSNVRCDLFENISNSYMGISDAGVDSILAFQQAYLRALSIVALRFGMSEGLSDFYNDANGVQISSNYEELNQLRASCNLATEALRVKDCYRLKSGELILFLKIDSFGINRKERVRLNSLCTIYYKENEQNGSRQIANKILLENESVYSGQIKGHTEKSTYLLNNNRWTSNEIIFDNKKNRSNKYKLFYETTESCLADTLENNQDCQGTIDGLWTAYVGSIYRQLSRELKQQFLKIKHVGEQYDNKITSLNRESGWVEFGCKVENVALNNNKLWTKINVVYQPKSPF